MIFYENLLFSTKIGDSSATGRRRRRRRREKKTRWRRAAADLLLLLVGISTGNSKQFLVPPTGCLIDLFYHFIFLSFSFFRSFFLSFPDSLFFSLSLSLSICLIFSFISSWFLVLSIRYIGPEKSEYLNRLSPLSTGIKQISASRESYLIAEELFEFRNRKKSTKQNKKMKTVYSGFVAIN